MIIGDVAEELEVFYPYYRFKEEGFEVHVAAPSVKSVNTVIHEGCGIVGKSLVIEVLNDIENAGGTFVDADVVVDGNIFSGKT